MKKIQNILSLLSFFLLFSCTFEEKNIFENSATERVDESIKKNTEILTSAANGWIMEYYPSSQQAYGGYTILVSFDKEGKATVSGDLFDADKKTTSLYSIIHGAGPLLTFDTHNDMFHFFSNPRNPAGFGSTGRGMEGDYEFLIMEASAEKVILRGRKTGNRIVMTPMKAGVKWNEYIASIQGIMDKTAKYGKFIFEYKGKSVATVEVNQFPVFRLFSENNDYTDYPFRYIATGIELYKPFVIGNDTIKELSFTWDDKVKSYKANNNIDVLLYVPKDYMFYDDFIGDWSFEYSDGKNSERKTADAKIVVSKQDEKVHVRVAGVEYPFMLQYNKAKGIMELHMHIFKQKNGKDLVFINPRDSKKDKILYAATPGLNVAWDGVSSPKVLTFKDDGLWTGFIADGFIMLGADADMADTGEHFGTFINPKLTRK